MCPSRSLLACCQIWKRAQRQRTYGMNLTGASSRETLCKSNQNQSKFHFSSSVWEVKHTPADQAIPSLERIALPLQLVLIANPCWLRDRASSSGSLDEISPSSRRRDPRPGPSQSHSRCRPSRSRTRIPWTDDGGGVGKTHWALSLHQSLAPILLRLARHRGRFRIPLSLIFRTYLAGEN